MVIMNKMMNHVIHNISDTVVELKKNAKDSTTIRPNDIQFAVRRVLTGELAKHTVSEGTKAVVKLEGKFDGNSKNNNDS